MKTSETKIGKFSFFEEKLELEKIFQSLRKENLKILDLGCGNGRLKILAKELCQKKMTYYGVDKDFLYGESCDIFFQWEILESFEKFKKLEESFDLIFLIGIFENNLEFSSKNLNQIYSVLNKDSFAYLSFWKFGFEKEVSKNPDLEKVKNFFEKEISPKIKKSKFGESYQVSFYQKQKNEGRNISVILKS